MCRRSTSIGLGKLVLVNRCDGSRFDPFAFCIFLNSVAATTIVAASTNWSHREGLAFLPATCFFLAFSLPDAP
jgi:hypothetical protein